MPRLAASTKRLPITRPRSPLRWSIPIGTPSPVVQNFAYAGAPVFVPDNNPLGASVTIPVTGVGRASKLTFSIDGTTCNTDTGSTTVGLDHTFVGDLVGNLIFMLVALALYRLLSGVNKTWAVLMVAHAGQGCFGALTLTKGRRSRVANLAAELL